MEGNLKLKVIRFPQKPTFFKRKVKVKLEFSEGL